MSEVKKDWENQFQDVLRSVSCSSLKEALKNQYINEDQYQKWASDHYNFPILKSNYFKNHPYAESSFWDKVKHLAHWDETLIPLFEWENILYVACLEPSEQEIKDYHSVVFLLSSVQEMESHWKRLNQKQVLVDPEPEKKELSLSSSSQQTLSISKPSPPPSSSASSSPSLSSAPPTSSPQNFNNAQSEIEVIDDNFLVSTTRNVLHHISSFLFYTFIGEKKQKKKIQKTHIAKQKTKNIQKPTLHNDKKTAKLSLDQKKSQKNIKSQTQKESQINIKLTLNQESSKTDPKIQIKKTSQENPIEIEIEKNFNKETPSLNNPHVKENISNSNQNLEETRIIQIKDEEKDAQTSKNPQISQDQKISLFKQDKEEKPVSKTLTEDPKKTNIVHIKTSDQKTPQDHQKIQINPSKNSDHHLAIQKTGSFSPKEDLAFQSTPNHLTSNPVDYILGSIQKYFDSYIIFNCKKNKFTPYNWSPHLESKKDKTMVADKPSIFKICYQTQKSYFGHIVPIKSNIEFFENWKFKKLPQHALLFPFISDRKVTGAFLGISEEKPLSIDILNSIEEFIRPLGQHLINGEIKKSAA